MWKHTDDSTAVTSGHFVFLYALDSSRTENSESVHAATRHDFMHDNLMLT